MVDDAGNTRWQRTDAPRGDDYDARWRRLAAGGQNVHGEADLVDDLMQESGGSTVLDAGCGTGRVAIELARRGYSVTGVDADPGMLSSARAKAPDLTWVLADLAGLADDLHARFDMVVLAGNVMIYLAPGSEGRVLAQLRARLRPGGLVVAGFQIRPGRLAIDDYDRLAAAAGLTKIARWASWSRDDFTGGDYAVSVHRCSD